MNFQDKIDFFIQLGLTSNQAKIYLALADSSPCTATQVSKKVNLETAVVYRTLPKLREKSLVERILATPVKFRATPIKLAIEILLRQRKQEDKKIREKAKEIVSNYACSKNQVMESQGESAQFVVVAGTEAIIKKLKSALQEAQTSIEVITAKKRFSHAILEFAGEYKKALKRRVRIRIATEKHEADKPALEIIKNLMNNPLFEIKYFSEPPEAIVSIIDKKEAFVSLSATAHLDKASSIFSYNISFVALANSYFETKWNSSQEKRQEDYFKLPKIQKN